jgi:thioesterase domain-containing protein
MEKILTTIEPYSSLNMKLEEKSENDSITMSIPLKGNLNDKKTMFAGSIYSVMVLAGWALAFKSFNVIKNDYDVVIKDSSVQYRLPVKSDAEVVAIIREPLKEIKNDNKSILISVSLYDAGGTVCAGFTGEYVGIRRK